MLASHPCVTSSCLSPKMAEAITPRLRMATGRAAGMGSIAPLCAALLLVGLIARFGVLAHGKGKMEREALPSSWPLLLMLSPVPKNHFHLVLQRRLSSDKKIDVAGLQVCKHLVLQTVI